jgi:hypothetical protein
MWQKIWQQHDIEASSSMLVIILFRLSAMILETAQVALMSKRRWGSEWQLLAMSRIGKAKSL